MLLQDKIAVVTGASRGIGRATAKALAREGAVVIVNYNGSKERADEVVSEIEKDGGKAKAIQCNVSDFEQAKEFFGGVVKEYGRIDILVNNAGITRDGLIMKMKEEDFDAVIETNLKGTFNTIRHTTRWMLKQKGGKIINISSMWGTSGASCEVAYSASKSGINGFTKALAKELAPSNVQVNAIACGVIDTSMNDQLTSEERKALEEEIPAGRYGTPKEIAQMVWNIVHAPEYMTGQIIGVDGGFL